MARRKIREYDAKRIFQEQLSIKGVPVSSFQAVLIDSATNIQAISNQHPWLLHNKLVVKPDQLFGKRKQYGLVLVDADFKGIQEYLNEHWSKEITVGKASGKLTHFLIEPFVPHDQEYYLCLVSEREGTRIYFSAEGGFNIEERWNTVLSLFVPTLENISKEKIQRAFPEISEAIIVFIEKLYLIFGEQDVVYLELNPFTIDEENNIHLLDAVAQVDDCAGFKHKEWDELSFPKAFGQKSLPEEHLIEELDKESGASLKLTILNPQGRIWNILSGGGASIIYLDTIAQLGKQQEIANYGEYSGNPTTEESYQYAKTILELMTREPHPQGKILIIGGAIANFTDVEKTFTGIVKALREQQEKLRAGNISIFVRRGGPNYERGLQLIREAGKEMEIPMLVQGPEAPLVEIVGKALEALK